MKFILVFFFSVFVETAIDAQSIKPVDVLGKVYMTNGHLAVVKGSRPIPGHNNFSSDDPDVNSNAPSNFTQFDGNMMKIFELARAVPALNPPVGFDTKCEMEYYHASAKGMYYGVLMLWMFAYGNDWSTKKNVPSGETAQIINIWVNDFRKLGSGTYFSDTMPYTSMTRDNPRLFHHENDMILLRRNRPIYVPYTIGQFLLDEKNFYQDLLQKNEEDLKSNQKELAESHNPQEDNLKTYDDEIKQAKEDLKERKKEKPENADEKKINQISIEADEAQIKNMTKAREESINSAAENNSIYEDAIKSQKELIDSGIKWVSTYKAKVQQIKDRYDHLSLQQRSQQAYVQLLSSFDDPEAVKVSDQWNETLVKLLPAGDHSGKALYQFNRAYFDLSHPSDIQLVTITHGAISDNPIPQRQLTIMKGIDYKKLAGMMDSR